MTWWPSGYADRADIVALGWDYYSWETAYGVQQLEEHLGVACPSGSLSLGQVVFKPEALRVSQVTGSLGGPASGPVLAATSDRHVVTIPLDASAAVGGEGGGRGDASRCRTGRRRRAWSPRWARWRPRPGRGRARRRRSRWTCTLAHPSAAGSLDQAPVTVNITTATARDVLVVPVTALLAQASGGYDVEVAGPGNTRRWVPVTPGIFDDADGLVQVTGALTPGQRVVVPAT